MTLKSQRSTSGQVSEAVLTVICQMHGQPCPGFRDGQQHVVGRPPAPTQLIELHAILD